MCRGKGDLESQHETYIVFEDPEVRHAFVRKVYLILTVMLLFTVGVIAIFVFADAPKRFVAQHPWLIWVALGFTFVLMIMLVCCETVRRTYPWNYICLGLFTLCEAFMMGVIASLYAPQEVLIAVAITTTVTFALTLFAMQTRCDFTGCGVWLMVILIVFMVFGIVVIFVPGKTLHMVYCSIGVLIFSFMIIYDTQLMLGGKHKYAISPEDYVFAVLSLFIDIINLFMFLLSLIGMGCN